MYSTNAEYRAVMRAYFNMDIQALEEDFLDFKNSDPESYDEMLYDDAAVERGMNDILDKTRSNPQFIALYQKAAGKFLSEDLETGLCVLLTYDFFADFKALYENPTDEGFQALLQKI